MTAESLCVEFGYLPEVHNFSVGEITVSTLPGWTAEKFAEIEKDIGVDGWIYAPPERVSGLFGKESEMPYPSRVFGLPKTHSLAHATASDPEHLSFLVWMFGFIIGMRLTDTKAGASRKPRTTVARPPCANIPACCWGCSCSQLQQDTAPRRYGPRIPVCQAGDVGVALSRAVSQSLSLSRW
jgi:hypothetical protein